MSISQNAANAFKLKQTFGSNNTTVTVDKNDYYKTIKMYLHGNNIAILIDNELIGETLIVSMCGYDTRVTRDRLNAIEGVEVTRKNNKTYLNGKEWNGRKVDVKEWNKLKDKIND